MTTHRNQNGFNIASVKAYGHQEEGNAVQLDQPEQGNEAQDKGSTLWHKELD
jgi:hypothetical protein